MFKCLASLCLLMFCGTALLAQKTDSVARGVDYSIAFEPVFGFNNCFKIDLEAKPLNHNFGIELTSEFYTGPHILNHNNDDISGYGIGLYHRLYILDDDKHPVIFSYGAIYRRINITYNDEGFIPYQKNGLEYYQYKSFTDVLKSQSLQVGVTANVRLAYVEHFFSVDTYAGAGINLAVKKAPIPDIGVTMCRCMIMVTRGLLFY